VSSWYRKKKAGKDFGPWYIRVKNHRGKWIARRTTARNATEAKALAIELEHKFWRVSQGLDELPAAASDMTFGELVAWWKKAYGAKLRSQTIIPFGEKHLTKPLFGLGVSEVTAGKLQETLDALVGTLKPQSLNHLRSFVSRIFERAASVDMWKGENPAKRVPKFKVPKGIPGHLDADEVPRMLAKIPEHRRPLFATAVYTALRMGELLDLQWDAVNLKERTLTVKRSRGADTTKGSHADVVPMPKRLVPYLETAKMAAGKSKYVFPGPDGNHMGDDPPLDRMLRGALGRAGIVTGYKLKCRKCGHEDESTEKVTPICPKCKKQKMWCSAVPRHVTFHQLRHTTATLLLKDGVPLAHVSKILRHSDPSITLRVYGHLDIEDMRKGIERFDKE
jgi:integrase